MRQRLSTGEHFRRGNATPILIVAGQVTPYSFKAVASLSVAPFRFHSPCSAIVFPTFVLGLSLPLDGEVGQLAAPIMAGVTVAHTVGPVGGTSQWLCRCYRFRHPEHVDVGSTALTTTS